ncbi:uncharacterized protein N7506_006824 [Penicillium brevicompactum]|nr:uncharacterized protein N7506_006824 [Penicillium brevicompactum]KAJ5333041.1 hypothetical protein N7506_006824 [Penicillium brevicompactum]
MIWKFTKGQNLLRNIGSARIPYRYSFAESVVPMFITSR